MTHRWQRGAARLGQALFLLTLLPGTAAAEAPPADHGSSAESEVERIRVTAPRLEEHLLDVPAAVGVVLRDEIQLARRQLTLGESLAGIPGVLVQDEWNFAQDLRISIRGFGARSNFGIRGIKLLVDGIPATLPDGQGQVDGIDLGSAGRIEVVRGPAASLYGSAAGGVIHVVSEEGPETPFVDGRVLVGSHGLQRYQAKAGGQAGAFGYLASLSREELDGYRNHSAMENLLFNSKLRYAFDERSDLTAVVNALDIPVADDPGALTAEEVAENRRRASPENLRFDAGESIAQASLGLVYRREFDGGHETQLSNFYVWRDVENKLPFTRAGSVDLDRFFAGGGLLHTHRGALFGHENRLMLGFDVEAQRDDRKRRDNDLGNLGTLRLDQREAVTGFGIFIEDELQLLESLWLTLGLRYDRVHFQVDDRHTVDRDDSGKLDFDELSPMGALRWRPSPAFGLYARVATSFETPTTTELAHPTGSGGFNRDLEAQTALGVELGAKGLLPGRLRYELAVFQVTVDGELIPFEIPGMSGRSFFVNAGESTRRGVELGLELQPLQDLVASLAYTWSVFEFDEFHTQSDVFDGNRIPGVPEHHLHAELFYRHRSGLYAGWELRYVSGIFADNANTVRGDAYLLSSLRLGYAGRWGNWEISPFVGLDNLFDEEYMDNLRLNAGSDRYFEPAPEFSAYAGLSLGYRFGPGG
jgi:iron complex outermembrane receptor protein